MDLFYIEVAETKKPELILAHTNASPHNFNRYSKKISELFNELKIDTMGLYLIKIYNDDTEVIRLYNLVAYGYDYTPNHPEIIWIKNKPFITEGLLYGEHI